MKKEGVSTLSIRGFPRALRYLLIFLKIVFVFVCFERFCLLYDNSCIGPQECDKAFLKISLKVCKCKKLGLSKYLRVNLPTLKKSVCFPLDIVSYY